MRAILTHTTIFGTCVQTQMAEKDIHLDHTSYMVSCDMVQDLTEYRE